MQVSINATGRIDRTMIMELSAERIDEDVDQRLRSMAAQVRIDGFRPGKAPLALVKKRHEATVRQEVLDKMLQETFQQAADVHRLRVAGLPAFDLKPREAGQNLQCVATFQVYPEIK